MSQDEAFVLYVDQQGHPAPLTECYHATASRRLSSAVDRWPPSTVTQVDSAYCPQCLSFHDATSAASLGYCPRASCAQCPLCVCVLSMNVSENTAFYQCGACDWNSKACQLTVPVNAEADGRVEKVQLARALEDLGEKLKQRKHDEKQKATEAYFKKLTDDREQRTKQQREEHRRKPLRSTAAIDGPEGWSVEALEASLEQKKKSTPDSSLEGWSVERLSLDETENVDSSWSQVTALSVQLQAWNSSTPLASLQELLPLPVPLRVRTSRRCRAELNEGRPGILVKPKLNPLEGDSSLRTGHGQWWKKDSSAVHVIPRVRIVQHATTNDQRVFLLKVNNPTLGMIRLRFAASSYPGEPDETTGDATNKTPLLKELLVDTLAHKLLDVRLEPNVLQQLTPTDKVELQSSEDSLMELGGKAQRVPDNVQNWQAVASKQVPAMRLVAQSDSTAWFELAVPELSAVDAQVSPALALALQIEVGDGSWQSSLVQPRMLQGDETDWVTLDLLITWKTS